VYANAEADAAIWCETGVRFGQGSLRVYRALHRLYGTSKFGKNAIARCVRYAAPVVHNELVEDRSSLSKPLERADLIGAHQPAVALYVCREDSYQPPGDFRKD